MQSLIHPPPYDYWPFYSQNWRGALPPLSYCQQMQGWCPRAEENHPDRRAHGPDLHTYHPPVALNKEGQHRITSAIGFHHLQTVPIEEIVNADLAICTGTDDPEEEKSYVEHLPGREQSNRPSMSSGKLLGFVCSLGDFVRMPGRHWS